MSYWDDRPQVDPDVLVVEPVVPLRDGRWPLLLFLLKPGQDTFYTGEFRAAGMLWLQRDDQLEGRLLPRSNSLVTVAGPPVATRADARYPVLAVNVRSVFSNAHLPFGGETTVSGEWLDEARPDGAEVALGPAWLISSIDRARSPRQLVRILKQAANRRDIVAGRIPVARSAR